MAVSSLLVLAEAWQSECAWCEEQETSQAQAETGLEISRSDSSPANELATLRIKRFYTDPGFFALHFWAVPDDLHVPGRREPKYDLEVLRCRKGVAAET